ncbi:hypothetical protein Plo01_15740 [Planobispora longispora]|uniref:Uncharacterized protein n=1 Tax=Planobispora longispora TaxID=28887 RepID=A0A8J3RI50_9ACTN|nr:hypothetical protein Plo01_15740 [Planobispora longispora]
MALSAVIGRYFQPSADFAGIFDTAAGQTSATGRIEAPGALTADGDGVGFRVDDADFSGVAVAVAVASARIGPSPPPWGKTPLATAVPPPTTAITAATARTDCTRLRARRARRRSTAPSRLPTGSGAASAALMSVRTRSASLLSFTGPGSPHAPSAGPGTSRSPFIGSDPPRAPFTGSGPSPD